MATSWTACSGLLNRIRGIELSVQSVTPSDHTESGPGQRRQAVPLRISIIVATRNRPALLARTLEHMQSQTYSNFEVIVVDDASSAETRAGYPLLWERLDRRFILLPLGEPGAPGAGPSVARNAGIAAATGSVLAFCDDDDFWTVDGHLAALARSFESDKVDMYIANQMAVSAAGQVEKTDWLPELTARMRGRALDACGAFLVSREDLVHSGGFAQLNILAVRKETAVAIGGFWTRTSYEEDRDFFWRAVDHARAIVFNPALVAQHNVPDPARKDNLSRSFSQAERWLISALVSQHIGLCVTHAAIRSLCLTYEGDILRHLSLSLSREGKHGLGLAYARRALAARGSLKWGLYTATLMCRQLLRKEPA
jgi:cellulose synthase/poly-beta-1,6-N-acetylglucosamine synthase-like glycosyltransferase